MWSAVTRTIVDSWNLGFALLDKISNNIFEEEDNFIDLDKMSQGAKNEEKTSEHSEEPTGPKQTSDGDPDATGQPEDVASTPYRLSTPANTFPKKTYRPKDSLSKMALTRLEGRTRQKIVSDPRFLHSGNEVTWHHTERPESSHGDILSSRWHYATDTNIKSEGSLRSHGFLSVESDIFPTRGVVLNNSNESGTKVHPLLKSSSSSQISSVKGNSIPSIRQLKFNGEKPPSICSLPPAYAPRNNCCCCSNACCRRTNRTESSLSLSDDAETPEGLSWRRLHMSRAKLKATATTSELLSGFAMVAMVELQINKPTAVPEWLFVLFAVCTTILVSVHIFALMISTYLLPNIEAVSKLHVSSLVTESPHDRMKSFIELAWAFSTILGLFLFLVEIAILCWVKFWDYSFTAAISATMIVIPVLILFVAFAIHFYHSLVVIKCKNSVYNMQELENIKRQLDNVSPA